MKAQELRMLNWVESPYGVSTVAWLSDNGIGIELHDTIYDFNDDEIKPIPLTGEWLVKFGFDNDGIEWFYEYAYSDEVETFKVFLLPDNSGYGVVDVNHFGLCLKYVHQLQNLYFVLTNTELEIIEQ